MRKIQMLAVNETNSCTVVKCLNIRIGKSASIWLLANVWMLSAVLEDGRLGWLEVWRFEGSADRRRPAWRMVGEAKKPELGLSSVKAASPPIWAPLIFFSCHIRTDKHLALLSHECWKAEFCKKSLLQATDYCSATNTWNQFHLIQEIFPGRLGTPPSVGGRQGARKPPKKILTKTWSKQSVTSKQKQTPCWKMDCPPSCSQPPVSGTHSIHQIYPPEIRETTAFSVQKNEYFQAIYWRRPV